MRSICDEVGCKPPVVKKEGEEEVRYWSSAAQAETALLNYLREKSGLFILNEAEDFGPPVLNLIKSILNETQCAVVILCVPEFYERIQKRQAVYAKQLMRRTIAVIVATDITAKMVMTFLEERWPGIKLPKPAEEIAKSANHFGGFDFIKRVRTRLMLSHPEGSGTEPDAEEVTEAINHYKYFVSEANTSTK